jgi:hypothetical protein
MPSVDHPTLRPIPSEVPHDIPSPAELRCFRVVWNSNVTWQVDVWADNQADAIRAASIAMDHEAFHLIGCIDLATTR